MKRRIVIIGGGVAGLVAAFKARQTDPESGIIILSEELYPPYCRPCLPSVIKGTVSHSNEIAMYPPQLLESNNILLLQGVKACNVDVTDKTIKVKDVKTAEERIFGYDALILATGGHSSTQLVKGNHLKNVFTLRTFKDAIRISEVAGTAKGAVVVGVGFVGLAIAEALNKRGVDTILVVRSRILRGLIEPDLSSYVQKKIRERGVSVLVRAEVDEIGGAESVDYVKVAGEKIEASMVIFAVGVRPSVKLAEEAGIKLGRHGIHVDDRMRTSVPEIYAAGDCVETLDIITKQAIYTPLGGIAARQGTIAGINAAGGDEKLEGFLRAQSDNPFGIEISSVGHGSVAAKALGIEVNVEDMELPLDIGKRSYLMEKYPIKAKVSVDKAGKVIGAQVVGSDLIAQNAYVLFKAIKQRMTVNELKELWRLPIATMLVSQR